MAYSESSALPQSPIVGLTNAWLAYAAAVSNLAPRTTMPLSVSPDGVQQHVGILSCGGLERSPLASVLAET